MKKEIALAAVVAALLGGFLVGREFPVHHYEPWKSSGFLYDTTTGTICNPMKTFEQMASKAKTDNTPNKDDAVLKMFQQSAEQDADTQPFTHVPSCE
jgi:hypothetical protein